MILPALYHWAPADRHDSIARHGLVAGSPSTVCTESIPLICLSPDPWLAWSLSGAMGWVGHVTVWDLWRVQVADTDSVRVRSEYGPTIREVKIENNVPADRLWFVGRREVDVKKIRKRHRQE